MGQRLKWERLEVAGSQDLVSNNKENGFLPKGAGQPVKSFKQRGLWWICRLEASPGSSWEQVGNGRGQKGRAGERTPPNFGETHRPWSGGMECGRI